MSQKHSPSNRRSNRGSSFILWTGILLLIFTAILGINAIITNQDSILSIISFLLTLLTIPIGILQIKPYLLQQAQQTMKTGLLFIGVVLLLASISLNGYLLFYEGLTRPHTTSGATLFQLTRTVTQSSTSTTLSSPALEQKLFHSENTKEMRRAFPSSVTKGNLIIVAITQWAGNISRVTDDQGDRYTPVVKEAPFATPSNSSDSIDGKNHDYIQLYYAKNVTGGVTTITVDCMAKGDTNVGFYEFSGLDKTAPVESNGAVSNTGTSQHPDGGMLKTATKYELCFVVGVDDDGNNTEPLHGDQYSSLEDHQDNSYNERFYTEYRIGQPGSYLTDFSIATESHWAVIGASFKSA